MSGSRREVIAQLSQSLQNSMGVPQGLQVKSPFPFAGINREASPIAIGDQEFVWLENYLKTGDGDLRALYDHGTPLYTTSGGRTIVSFSGFNIASSYYFAVFLDDGTAYQVNQDTGAVTTISSVPTTFYNGGNRPATCPSGGQYLLISNNHTANAYWIWDGAALYQAGTLGPTVTLTSSGSSYTSAPAVQAVGGSGTGATFVATVANGAVTSVVVSNAGTGYLPGDVVQLRFSGGGSDSTAILQAVLTAGTIGSLRLVVGGSGYTSVPAVSFSTGAATATASLTATTVASNTVTAGGAGYTSTPNVVISGGGGSGATATATVVANVVTAIAITNAGTGYTSVPTVTITGGGGVGATATATLTATSVGSVALTSGGSGYTGTPTVTFTGGGGAGASAVATLNPGSVSSITVVDGGSGYDSTPGLTISGGGGTGATATAVLTGGVITSVTVTAAGSGYTSTPTIAISTAANSAAAGTLELMPFNVSGAAIENYLSRVWLVNLYQPGAVPTGGKLIASAPASLTDFALSSGGVGYTSRDRYLREKYYSIRQSNGYLYPLGDSSVSVISNVQTSGVNVTTTFSYQNTDPQVGLTFRDALADFGRTILFANPVGVYGLYGGAVTKISGKVDNIFDRLVLPPTAGAITPSAAVATIFNTKVFVLLLSITDPFTGALRNVMLLWNEKDWFIASQTESLLYVSSQERNSNLTTWGTNGTQLFQLFSTPSAELQKKMVSKLYGADLLFIDKLAVNFYVIGESYVTGSPVVFNWYTNWGGASGAGTVGQGFVPSPNNPITLGDTDTVGTAFMVGATDDVDAMLFGFTLTSQSPDHSVYLAAISYLPRHFIGGT
jgi:hypothetical protein